MKLRELMAPKQEFGEFSISLSLKIKTLGSFVKQKLGQN